MTLLVKFVTSKVVSFSFETRLLERWWSLELADEYDDREYDLDREYELLDE